jgi:hypothetical protein
MRLVSSLAIVLLVLVHSQETIACKCAPGLGVTELARDHVIFAGRSMEQIRRCWHYDPKGDRDEQHALGSTGEVTRFKVTYSRDLAPGTEQLVFTNPNSKCAPYYRVGEEHLVVAFKVAGHLLASGCPHVFEDLARELRPYLGVPPESSLGLLKSPQAYAPADCSQPSNVQQAVTTADAVVWSDSIGACVIGDSQVVEHAVVVTESWKGLSKGTSAIVRVRDSADDRHSLYPFEGELTSKTGHTWPPAEFLRLNQDGTFTNDGCLAPIEPVDLEDATKELTRLLPIGSMRAFGSDPCLAPESLSCSHLNQSVFKKAGSDLIAFYRNARNKDDERGKRPNTKQVPIQGPTRSGSCAGCSLPSSSASPVSWTILLFFLAGARHRTRKPA